MPVLHVDNVVKRYGDFTAVDRISFEAQQGRIFGLLGPNGAGKTSTIRMITYILVPDEGRILFNGQPVGPKSQQQMGYLPEERGLYKKMKVGEQLMYLCQLKGMTADAARERIRYWLDRFDARDWAKKKIEELSKGQGQKIQFIATIAHDPDLLIFDEPFSGLDPINAELLKEVILELREQGKTILFASHRMEQVEQMCDDICLMANGRPVLQGTLRDVKAQFGRDTVALEFDGSPAFLDTLEAEGKIRVITRSQHTADVRLLGDTPPRLVLDAATQHLDEIYRYHVVEPPLNEIFISVVTDKKREDAHAAATA